MTLGLAKFEADSGKAARIIGSDSDKMARATEKADAAVRRLAQRYTEVGVESKIVAAAMAGASDNALRLFANIGSGGAAFARVGEQGSAAFKAIGAASETELQKTQARILLIAEKVRNVRDQAATLTQQAASQRESGALTDDSLKIRLAGIRAAQKADLERIATAARGDAESQRAATAEVAATNQRIAAFERLRTTVAQLKFKDDSKAQVQQAAIAKSLADSEAASAEKRAAAFQKLRDTVAQLNFKQQQEQTAALKATADADISANERRKASTQALIDKLNGVPEAYRKQVAALQESLVKGDITPKQFQTSVLQATSQRPDIQKAKAEQAAAAAEIIASEKKIAAESKDAADARVASARKILDAQKGLLPTYREELKALRALRDDGLLTQAQFKKAGADLVTRQPIVNADPARIDRIRQSVALFGNAAATAAAKTKLTNYELQTLNFTISDVVASLASGISPTTILLQQGGQVRDVFGGFGPFFSKIGAFFTPLNVAIGGTVAALGALAVAFLSGQKASREFADAITLSGNFAGQTESTFNALAKSISANGLITVAATREFAQELIRTGEVGPRVFAVATEAAVRLGAATGKSAKDVASEFASMNRDVSAGASKLNQSLNFLTASQLQHIKLLQDEGKAVEAQLIVYDALVGRLRGLDQNLGIVDIAIRNVTGNWSRMIDAFKSIGKVTEPEDQLSDIERRLNRAANNPNLTFAQRQSGGVEPALSDAQRADLEGKRSALLSARATKEAAAATSAATAQLDKEATAAAEFVKGFGKRTHSVQEMNLELAKAQAHFDKLTERAKSDPKLIVPSAAAQKAILQDIRESFTKKPDRGGESEAEALRKAQLAADLEFTKQQLTKEQDALRFNQQELQAIYAAGSISLKAFFDAKEAIIREGVEGELNALIDEQARLEVELAKPGLKGSTKVDLQKRRDASVEASERIQRKADEAATLGSLERAAAQKVLTDRVVDFRANLLQLAGDEEGAAKLRTDQAIAAAQAFARLTNSQGESTVGADEVARFTALTLAANRFAEAQRQVGIETAKAQRAEQLFLLRAEQSGKSRIETEQGLTDIRQKSLDVLRARLAVMQAEANTPADIEAAASLAAQIEIEADRADEALNRLRDSVKSTADSIAEDIGGAINEFKGFKPLIESISKTLLQAGTKFFVTDPLKLQLEGLFRGVSEGDNPLANLLKGAAGVGGSTSGKPGEKAGAPVADSLKDILGGASTATATQTAAVTASTTAITTMTAGTTAQATATTAATSAISTLAAAASAAASALSTVAASSGISGAIGGGGGFGTGAIFGNQDYGAFFHDGGIVGSGGAMRPVPRGTWANAMRYRGGGIAGLKPDEVPAILHRREEVLRRDDPRHRWNGGTTPSERAMPPMVIQVQAAQGASRESAQQFGVQVGMGMQKFMRRGA